MNVNSEMWPPQRGQGVNDHMSLDPCPGPLVIRTKSHVQRATSFVTSHSCMSWSGRQRPTLNMSLLLPPEIGSCYALWLPNVEKQRSPARFPNDQFSIDFQQRRCLQSSPRTRKGHPGTPQMAPPSISPLGKPTLGCAKSERWHG